MLGDVIEWRPLSSAPNLEISDCGDLRFAESGRRLRGYINSDGYLAYKFRNPSGSPVHRLAHRLVAEAFLDPPSPGQDQIAHKNGSRLDNRPVNLRWDNALGNQRDRFDHGTSSQGEANGRSKITESDVLDIRREYRLIKRPGSGRKVSELDNRYGLNRTTIVSIATGKSWAHVPMPTEAALGMA